jgi:hypothetical protein
MLNDPIKIRDQLIPALKAKYGDTFEVGDPSEFIAMFPAKHEKVGRLMLYEAEDYLTYVIEHVAHDHIYFDNFDGTYKPVYSVVREAMQYVDELFDDRILMGLQKDLMGGTIIPLFAEDDPYAFMEPHYDYFVWSGPLDNPTEDNGSPG